MALCHWPNKTTTDNAKSLRALRDKLRARPEYSVEWGVFLHLVEKCLDTEDLQIGVFNCLL